MKKGKKLVCVFAHPDDEAFGPGGTIAKYAKFGEVFLICVTDGDDKTNGIKNLKKIRKAELKASAKILGIEKVFFLGYKDGELSNNIYHKVSSDLEKILRKLKPDTLMTFEPQGVSGHIDHVFCSMVTSYLFQRLSFIKTLLYYCLSYERASKIKDYFIYFPPGYKSSEVDKIVDVSKYWDLKLKAIQVHQSQAHDIKRVAQRLKNSAKEEYFLLKKK